MQEEDDSSLRRLKTYHAKLVQKTKEFRNLKTRLNWEDEENSSQLLKTLSIATLALAVYVLFFSINWLFLIGGW